MARLTDRQRKFCDEYLIDLNYEQAAIRAGYSPRYARGNAHKLVANSCIKAEIDKRMSKREKRTEITQDFVLKELVDLLSVNATDYIHVVEKQASVEVNGEYIELYDRDGNPVKYRTLEPVLTEELTEKQKKAIATIKKGRDGFEINTYDKTELLKLLGAHLGLWNKKGQKDIEEQQARIDKLKAEAAKLKGEESGETQDDGFLEALRGAVDVWEE
jgi:phage terminase small subunit